MKQALLTLCIIASILSCLPAFPQDKPPHIIAYYIGDPVKINNYPVEKLTHLIFSFGHLKDDTFYLRWKTDTLLLQNMVALKARNPQLKVLLSLGGWGGCETCSHVFSTKQGRENFALSVKRAIQYFGADGIDLDWEYPVLPGFPGHPFSDADKDNFTRLVVQLRKTLGKTHTISFAAGGSVKYIQKAIDWKKVMKQIDFVNLMSYDLYKDSITAHHTALYSSPCTLESADNTIRCMDSMGVPLNKIVIGAAFYARVFQTSDTLNNGIDRAAVQLQGSPYRLYDSAFAVSNGFKYYWDDKAKAPYAFNSTTRMFASFDDTVSVQYKTLYVLQHKLYGIMFWQLGSDKETNGLVDEIYKTATENKSKK